MSTYDQRSRDNDFIYSKIKKKHQLLGFIRVLVFLVSLYSFYLFMRQENFQILIFTGLSLVAFIVLLRIHANMSWKVSYYKALRDINDDEHNFIDKGIWNFKSGKEFEIGNHPYSFDLDIFGERSLFQYLNRTYSYLGSKKLADYLNRPLSKAAILKNQHAIKELRSHLDFRQQLAAYCKLANVDKQTFTYLKHWSESPVKSLPKIRLYLAYMVPLLLGLSLVGYFVNEHQLWGYFVSLFFSLNLILATLNLKSIQSEITGADKIHQTIDGYAAIFKLIQSQDFKSEKLQEQVHLINSDSFQAIKEFKVLSSKFEKLNTIANLFVNIVFNGFWQFHVHCLSGFLTWKKHKASYVMQCIEVVSEFEVLNSLANFSYNNPNYVLPVLQDNQNIYFKNMGHPLLNPQKRVTNDLGFAQHQFVILTGSNMSGKSTFLRTVGVNFVLAGIGAPVCAEQARFYPLPLYVSMRLTDSLEDSESYFYAEVKRLKEIVERAESGPCFVLLDEILRGTNSDDKQSGTIGVIYKLIRNQTLGIIATHDLEVCQVADVNPDKVVNKCFEVTFQDEELVFDYKIQDGVCQSKNATFIMKKMNIID